ncbi:MAG: dTDP-4-dehydrorhamnose 3,5-epimerase family protein [Kiritimatiellales bacterium]|nr:dTDP-4-dehydrorhamnose 3,5-epimerase family protein [Kiritimatiellales bacterium]
MKFEPAPLKDAWIIREDPIGDDRGYFARAFCKKEFANHGIDFNVAQINTCFNMSAGTIRGLHYQSDPAAEPKFVRCIRGAMWDVMVDMRPESSTYLQYFGIELTEDNQTMVYLPGNFAHGFQTLKPETQAYYLVGEYYTPQCENGIRHNDPALGIEWPVEVSEISDKDKSWSLL